MTYQAMTTRSPDVLDPFDYDYPALATECLQYSLYQTAGTDSPVVTTAFPYNGAISFTSPLTLNIGVTTALSISDNPSQVYNFRVRAYNPLTFEVAYAPCTVTITHECTG